MNEQPEWYSVFTGKTNRRALFLALVVTSMSTGFLNAFLGNSLERFMPWIAVRLFFAIPSIGVGGLLYYLLVRHSSK